MQSNAWFRNGDRRMDSGLLRPFLTVENKPGTSMTFALKEQYEDVLEAFSLSDDAEVLPGSYRFLEEVLEFHGPRGWSLRPNVTLTTGKLYDGSGFSLNTSMNWAVNRHLELVPGWQWVRVRFNDRGQLFNSHLVRLQARGAVDIHFSIDAFLQYNSLTRQVSTNARFRYNFREGQDLWFVWNEGLNVDRDPLAVPRLPLSGARTLTLKYTHTLIF